MIADSPFLSTRTTSQDEGQLSPSLTRRVKNSRRLNTGDAGDAGDADPIDSRYSVTASVTPQRTCWTGVITSGAAGDADDAGFLPSVPSSVSIWIDRSAVRSSLTRRVTDTPRLNTGDAGDAGDADPIDRRHSVTASVIPQHAYWTGVITSGAAGDADDAGFSPSVPSSAVRSFCAADRKQLLSDCACVQSELAGWRPPESKVSTGTFCPHVMSLVEQ